MDGVFMKTTIKIAMCLLMLVSILYVYDVWQDKMALQQNLIRLHVVANSNSQKDQEIKLHVKNAVVAYLQPLIDGFANKDQATKFVEDNLAAIQHVANGVLEDIGSNERAVVSFRKEAFDTRTYDTFSLPAGIYDSLRIQIGEGQGKNWWCVVFPSLCLPATSDAFQNTAVSSGFSETLGDSLANGRNLRFYILDCFGRLENIFH